MDKLFAWAGLKPTVRSTHRTLSTDEVLCMAKGRLIDIGAHTITHPVLSPLPPADAAGGNPGEHDSGSRKPLDAR